MEDHVLQEILAKNYIFIQHTPCGYTWGLISNFYCKTTKQALSRLVTNMNDLLKRDEFKIKKTKNNIACYTLYHDNDKIISFYKTKKKNHGILVINDCDALDTITESLSS